LPSQVHCRQRRPSSSFCDTPRILKRALLHPDPSSFIETDDLTAKTLHILKIADRINPDNPIFVTAQHPAFSDLLIFKDLPLALRASDDNHLPCLRFF
jgi:hypothetical protein